MDFTFGALVSFPLIGGCIFPDRVGTCAIFKDSPLSTLTMLKDSATDQISTNADLQN